MKRTLFALILCSAMPRAKAKTDASSETKASAGAAISGFDASAMVVANLCK